MQPNNTEKTDTLKVQWVKKVNQSPPMPKKRLFCQTVSNDYDESQFCNDDDKFDLHHDNAVMTFINIVNNHWFTKGKTLHKKANSTK